MKSPGALPVTAVDVKVPKVTYPGFCLSDTSAKEFEDDHDPKLGDYFTATVRLCVNSLTADEYGTRIQFDVEKLDDIAPGEEEGESGEDEGEEPDETETKALGYKREASKKEAPDLSSKTLED